MADSSEFPRLFLPLQGDLLAYILSVGVAPAEAEDLLHDAACVLLAKIGDFQAGTNFRAWAYAVVKNGVAAHFRKGKRRALMLDDGALAQVEQMTSEATPAGDIRQGQLVSCLEKLPVRSRQLIDLRYTRAMPLPSIAATLGRPVESVYVTLSRIRRALQRCVESQEQPREELA